MITWTVLVVLAAGVFGQRLLGLSLVSLVGDSARWQRWHDVLDALPLAIIAAVVALQTSTSAGSIVIDARSAGLAAATLCLWRRLPLAVVVAVAAATTALVRLAA